MGRGAEPRGCGTGSEGEIGYRDVGRLGIVVNQLGIVGSFNQDS